MFAYGQTGSGKTHTMQGVSGDMQHQGLIPRMIDDVFEHIYEMDTTNSIFGVQISYVEIYMERIRDLLQPTNENLRIREKVNDIYIEGVQEPHVSDAEEIY